VGSQLLETPFLNPRVLAAFDGMQSHVAILDPAGSILYINAAWSVFAAKNYSQDLQSHLGANYLDVCRCSAEKGDALASEALAGICSVISGNSQRFMQRYPCDVRGVERWFMMTATRVRHGCEIVITHDDITALVNGEKEGFEESQRSEISAAQTVAGHGVVLVHPSRLFSEGLQSIFQNTPYKLALQADNLESLNFATFNPESELIFLVGGCVNAECVKTVQYIRNRMRRAIIVVISADCEPPQVRLMLEAGANCYLRETVKPQTLIMAIELVLQGEVILPAEFLESLPGLLREIEGAGSPVNAEADIVSDVSDIQENYATDIFTDREKLILQGLIDGAPNKIIAQKLDIAESTVKVHVKAILRKIGVKNRTQAAMWAVNRSCPH
jgi:two-component system nitrate/nitrite response regulator NarL